IPLPNSKGSARAMTACRTTKNKEKARRPQYGFSHCAMFRSRYTTVPLPLARTPSCRLETRPARTALELKGPDHGQDHCNVGFPKVSTKGLARLVEAWWRSVDVSQ